MTYTIFYYLICNIRVIRLLLYGLFVIIVALSRRHGTYLLGTHLLDNSFNSISLTIILNLGVIEQK